MTSIPLKAKSNVACGTTATDSSSSSSSSTAKAPSTGRVVGEADSLVVLKLDLDGAVAGGNATITLTGPADVWFGVAFGATEMKVW
jgi:hypothetical protein